ncbi:hypothetical protein AAHB65_29975 [Bacillus toyonensis]
MKKQKEKEAADIYIYTIEYNVPLHISTILSHYYAARKSTNR